MGNVRTGTAHGKRAVYYTWETYGILHMGNVRYTTHGKRTVYYTWETYVRGTARGKRAVYCTGETDTARGKRILHGGGRGLPVPKAGVDGVSPCRRRG
jgi:hypothetical protein